MRHEFDAKVYRKYGLMRMARDISCLVAVIVAVNIFLVEVNGRELSFDEPLWLWGQMLIPLFISVIGYVYHFFKRRSNAEFDYVNIEQGTDGEPKDVSVRVDSMNYLIESVTALRRTLMGNVIVRGVILRMDGAQCIDKKKKLVIPPCFENMDGILRNLERYQRVLNTRAWEEAHDTRI